MKISIERGALLKAVSQAQSVVERRNTIPILANVLIEAEGDGVFDRDGEDIPDHVAQRVPVEGVVPERPEIVPAIEDAAGV